MSAYTPPALNAVDFALEATTPADVSPYVSALSAHTVPALNAVDFALSAYTPPVFQDVGWELLSTIISGTVTSGQGSQSVDATGNVASSAITGTATTDQGSQTATATALLQFIGTQTSGQGSQTVSSAALLQFVGTATSGQGQTVSSAALLQFLATETSSQAGQTVDALGTTGTGIIGTAVTGQGGQTVDATGEAEAVAAQFDGGGVGAGPWLIADHGIRHKGMAKAGQAAQTTSGAGEVINPSNVISIASRQAKQSTVAVGDVSDPELEEFLLMAAALYDDDWQEAA